MEVAAWNRRTGVGAAGERKGRDLKGMNASSSFGRAGGGGGEGEAVCFYFERAPHTQSKPWTFTKGRARDDVEKCWEESERTSRFFWLLHSNRSLARSSAKKNERKWSTKSPWIRTPRRPLPLPRPPSTAWTRCHRTGSWRRRTRYQRRRREEKRSPMRARSPPPSPSHALSHPTPPSQRFAFRLATDPASKAALQAEIVAAYTAHGRRG